ncbi:MAG: ParB/RepB/Spo0J family partition protein [Bacteroidota bacterium]
MANKGTLGRPVLGRGLQALLGEEKGTEQGPREIAVEAIAPGRYQARTEVDNSRLQELADSIRQHGVVQPVVVRPVGTGYELVVGERRWRAAQLAGLRTIPAVVRELDERTAMELGLIENLQREDLNPLDEAEAYRRLMEEFGLTQEEVAAAVGKQRSTVGNALRLLSLSAGVQHLVRSSELSAGHAKVLAGVEEKGVQEAMATAAVRGNWSVRELEERVRQWRERRMTGQRQEVRSGRGQIMLRPELREVIERVQSALGTRVHCRPGKKKGVLEIEYYSQEDLERIVERIAGAREF